MPSKNNYKPTLVWLMSYLDNQDCGKDHDFTQQRLGVLTPDNLMWWFNEEIFHTPTPPANHNLQPGIRSSTVAYWKKALSFFMPNRLMV
jgi:hypothetical protein